MKITSKRMFLRCIIVLFITAFPSFYIKAQVIALNDLLDKANNNYPLLRQRRAEADFGIAHERTVKGIYLPALLLQNQTDIGTTNSISGSYFPLGIVPSVSGGNTNSSRDVLNEGNISIAYLQWEFCNFGYNNAIVNTARKQSETLQASFEAEKYLLTQQIALTYIDLLKKYKLLQIKNEDVLRAGIILTSIRANVLSGLKPGVDSSTARASYSAARIAYLQAEEDYERDKILLGEYSGVKIDKNAVPDTNINLSGILQHLFVLAHTDSINIAHPLLNVLEKQYELQIAENNSASKKYLPHIGLNATYWLRSSGISPTGTFSDNIGINPGLAMPYSRYNYLVGLSATYNIFDIKHRHDIVAENKYKADAKQYAIKTSASYLNSLLEQTNSALGITSNKLIEIPIQQASAQQAYEQQIALYKSGLNTLIDVTNAQFALLQAETNFVITQTELLQLLYMRASLNGASDLFLKNFK